MQTHTVTMYSFFWEKKPPKPKKNQKTKFSAQIVYFCSSETGCVNTVYQVKRNV